MNENIRIDHIYSTELNDLSIIICLIRSEVTVEGILFCHVIEKLMERGIHCLPYSYTNEFIDLLLYSQDHKTRKV